jgi:hypothetical protein
MMSAAIPVMELSDHFHVDDVIMYGLGLPGIKNISGSISLCKNRKRYIREYLPIKYWGVKRFQQSYFLPRIFYIMPVHRYAPFGTIILNRGLCRECHPVDGG